MHFFESDQVETKYRLARYSNHMDGKDCSFESSERAIICHTNPATYWKYAFTGRYFHAAVLEARRACRHRCFCV
jgi:hypothetical protein